MTNNQDAYLKGYEDCLKMFEHRINYSIAENNGAKTPVACIRVLNDVIDLSHSQRLEVDYIKAPQLPDGIFIIVDKINIH